MRRATASGAAKIAVSAMIARACRLAMRRSAWLAGFGGAAVAWLALSSAATAHVLPTAFAERRAEAFLEDLGDDALNPVISSEYACFRISHHRVRCDLFTEYLDGDTCVFKYDTFFASPRSHKIRTRLGSCE
jgi:hypothetical protein